jgi:phytoene dehydrogenase-like protein
VVTAASMQDHNENYVGGDINGGAGDIGQFGGSPDVESASVADPVDGVWVCSASTPPGGGVHGMGGFHAANDLLAQRR